jgi:hypothetical protein
MTGLVIGMGDGLPAAATFAGATGRRLLNVPDPSALVAALARSEDVSITIAGGSSLTSGDLMAVTRTANQLGKYLGFIPGWASAQSARFVEKLTSYSWLADRTHLLWSHVGVGRLHPGRFGATEYVSPDEDLSTRLTIPRHAAALVSHSNGVDAPLGQDILCSTLTEKPRTPGRGFLPCGYPGGPCVRAERVGGVLTPPTRYRAQDVAADVVIWSACYGVLTADSLFDAARSIAVDFTNSRWACALLSTYKDIEDEVWPSLLALALLAEGRSLGEICAEINRLTASISGGDTPWLLLGDPQTAFAPTSQPLYAIGPHAQIVTLQPGINLARLPSTDPSVVTASAPSGEPVGADQVFVRQMPASDRVVLIHGGRAVADYVLRAEDARSNIRFTALGAIRASVAGPAFSLAILDHCPSDPRTSELADEFAALRKTLADRLDRNLTLESDHTDIGLAGNLSGADADSVSHIVEIAGWIGLNAELAGFIATYCQRNGTLETPTDVKGAMFGRPRLREASCCYCGMPVTQRESVLRQLGVRRRTNWCLRCGLLSDTSEEVAALSLRGPGTLRPSRRYSYILEYEDAVATDWRVLHASLCIERVPWPVRCQADMRVTYVDPGELFPSTEMSISLDEGVAPGVYHLVAAIAAHGDLWTARRPVLVAPGSAAPFSG